MSRGINKVILIGNLGAEPEVRSTADGTLITSIRVATSESRRDPNTGQLLERTEWHRVRLFGRLAEMAGKSLAKGQAVYIEGSLHTEKYRTNGIERTRTTVIGRDMMPLGNGPTA